MNNIPTTQNQATYMIRHLMRNGYKAAYVAFNVVSDAPMRTLENMKKLAENIGR